MWLVLDDYHLADDPDIARGMTFLVEHLPPNAHVVLSTRADPDLPLARWRAKGELVEIRASDLRFTSAETATYLDSATTARLTIEQVRTLEHRTEGWIAALQLAALSLRGRVDVAGFIDGFAGDDRYVVDYLVEEVLTHQPPPVREFLLHSAVLDRLTAPLCDAVVGGEDADAMLRTLDRANLFLVALDDKREWYRYHQLFADVLRARLHGERPDLVPVLHHRASQWFDDHDLPDPAIRHALAAGEVDRAAELIEMAMPAVRRHRQEAMAQSWLTRTSRARHRAQPGALCPVRRPASGRRRPRRGAGPPRRRGARARRAATRRSPAGHALRGAAHLAVDDRRLPRVTGPGTGRRRRDRPTGPAGPGPRGT